MNPSRWLIAVTLVVVTALATTTPVRARSQRTRGRIFVLMIWDGLRPDLVNAQDTPALAALEHEGVTFEHHHSVYPTLTMVNASALATGQAPGITGILGNSMYFAPFLKNSSAQLADLVRAPVDIEHTPVLATLDGPGGLDGKLLGAPSIAQEVADEHGYVAIVGKQGPTFLFNDHAVDNTKPRDGLFITGDQSSAPPMIMSDPNASTDRDAWYTRMVIERALPAAKAAAKAGHPALIVLWQHNPDLSQHMAGLGTQLNLNALHHCDANLGHLREALGKAHLERDTDLMVVSDHGFATIRMEVGLSDLLVAAGLKKSRDSSDIVIARNGGSDLVYLSPQVFDTTEARRAMLARIVDFAAAQDWSGPIFAHAGPPPGSSAHDPNLGWIPGTFSQDLAGVGNAARSPDLLISFRELPDLDNRDLTGPANPAFVLGVHGQSTVPNHSAALAHPVLGVVYADNGGDRFTTGMGMHGAAGERELHNFDAVIGPDFKHHFDDTDPTGNRDVAPTIHQVLGLPAQAAFGGRVLAEALNNAKGDGGNLQNVTATTYLALQGAQIVTQLNFTSYAGFTYLDSSNVTRNPIGPPQ